ncbi:hypothetical protein [Bacillus sp. Brlt_9]|uniref:hypothetical protein n=1 Tax=Bacillus sp. Brlt_9 TaxID=3110916 RepID=UPI003F7BD09F
MKIWKLKKYERDIVEIINLVPKNPGNVAFFDELKNKVMFNKPLERDEFATLYYAAVLVFNVSLKKGPDIVIAPMFALQATEKLDELIYKTKTYQQIIQNLAITLALTKPNGKEFCEGSKKFTAEEYKERQQEIESDLAEMQGIASKYIEGIEGAEVEVQHQH